MSKILSLSLYLHQPERVAEWYRVRGFAVRKRGLVHHVAVGWTDLRLIPGLEDAWFRFTILMREVTFSAAIDTLRQAANVLKSDNSDPLSVKERALRPYTFFSKDPAGNLVTWQAKEGENWLELPKPRPWTVGISEIILPVSDLEKALSTATKWLPVWQEGRDPEIHAASIFSLGGPAGSIKLIPAGTIYALTSQPAMFFPCSATLEHDGRRVSFNTLEGEIRWE